jgi:hemerythrin-like metal-binding protein
MSDHNSEITILLVEDEEINMLILEEVLKTNNYGVIVAKNGNEAIEKAIEFIPDLILLDIVMPEMDGYEVCMRLKDNPLTRDIPIIFVTAKIEEVNEELGLEFGAVDYIKKPINPTIVLSRVKIHLELRAVKVQLQNILSETNEKIDTRQPVSEEAGKQNLAVLESAQDFLSDSEYMPVIEKMNNKIEWFGDLSLGDEKLDSQNKEYLSLLNRLIKISNEDEESDDVVNIVKGLVNYTYEHFMSEEEYMALNEFPLQQEHRNEHMGVLKRISKYLGEVEANREGLVEELIDLMKEWLTTHIMISDQKYALWVKSRANM